MIEDGEHPTIIGDPVDTALLSAAQQAGLDIEHIRSEFPLVSEIPFSSERKMMTTINVQGGRQIAITKGAPGVVLAHCISCSDAEQKFSLADERCQSIHQTITRLQSEGMYVLGLASRDFVTSLPSEEVEQGMTFLGLLALINPPRPHAAKAIAEAHGAGIRVVMITGYFPLSAKMLLWVNVVTDLIPASALAADPAVPHVMKRRPRRHDEPILNRAIDATIAGSIFRTLIAYTLIFWVGLQLGGVEYARTMLFTSIVLHAFTRVMVVRQLDDLTLWSNRALLVSYAVAVGLQLLALYTPLRDLFGIVPLDWRVWLVMVAVVVGSSLSGVYMTRWILKVVPMWQ